MAFVLHTWGRGFPMLMGAIGFRSLEMSPLQRLEGLCDCKAPGQVLQLLTAGWILPFLFNHLPFGWSGQLEVGSHCLRRGRTRIFLESLGCFLSPPGSTPWGFEKPQLTYPPKMLAVLFFSFDSLRP